MLHENENFRQLRYKLKERRDIRQLGEGVYEAEALDGDGKLPSELIYLLKEARQYYDETRRQQGEETTAMRFGDLKSRYNALQQITNCVIVGHKYIYDNSTSTERPAYEVLREAQLLFERACDDSAQYELDTAEKNMQNNPRYVLQRLEKALQEPFNEIWRRRLGQKLDEVSNIFRLQQRAEAIRDNAIQETDVLQKFQGLLEAYTVFEHTPGLQEQLAQARHIAISVLVSQVTDNLQLTKILMETLELETARKQIQDSKIRVSNWPESEKPQDLRKLNSQLQEMSEKLWSTERAWREYTHYSQTIRERVILPYENHRAAQLFDEIISDTRFQNFPDLRILKIDVQTYRSLGEQLGEAISAYNQSNWLKAIEISDGVLKSGTAGQLANEFIYFRSEAQLELNIQILYEKIFAENYKEARYLLSQILSTQDEGKKAYVVERLNSEIRFLKEKTGF
jgi:hypothetical protein